MEPSLLFHLIKGIILLKKLQKDKPEKPRKPQFHTIGLLFHRQNIIKDISLMILCLYLQNLNIFIKKTRIKFKLVQLTVKILDPNQYQINTKSSHMISHLHLLKFNLMLIL